MKKKFTLKRVCDKSVGCNLSYFKFEKRKFFRKHFLCSCLVTREVLHFWENPEKLEVS